MTSGTIACEPVDLPTRHLRDRDRRDDADDEGQERTIFTSEGHGLVDALIRGEAALAGLDQDRPRRVPMMTAEAVDKPRHHEGLEIAGTGCQ